jgi:hypothetical protein
LNKICICEIYINKNNVYVSKDILKVNKFSLNYIEEGWQSGSNGRVPVLASARP